MSSTKKDDFITKISSLFEPKKNSNNTPENITNLTSKKSTNNEFLGESNKFNNYNLLSENKTISKVKSNSQKSSTKSENLFSNIFSKNIDNIDTKENTSIKSIIPSNMSIKKTIKKDSSIKNSIKDNQSKTNSFNFFNSNNDNSVIPSDNTNNSSTKSLFNKNSISKSIEKASNIIPTDGFNFKKILLWIGIFILLAFFGFNIFTTIGNFTETVKNIFKPILSIFGLATIDLTSKSLDVATKGAKGVGNVSANVLDSGLDVINNTSQSGLSLIRNKISNNSDNDSDNDTDSNSDSDNDNKNKFKNTLGKMDTYNSKDIDKLSRFIDSNFDNVNKFNSNNNKSCKSNCLTKCNNESGSSKCNIHCDRYCDEVLPTPDPFIENSRVQSNRASGKSGFCYVGEENGIRSCVKVNEHDVCTSGKIYPSQAICRNPSLRK